MHYTGTCIDRSLNKCYSLDKKLVFCNPISKSTELIINDFLLLVERWCSKVRQVGICSNDYHGFNTFDALEGMASAGFHNVELSATEGWTRHVSPQDSFEQLETVRNKMDELGLKPFSMAGHCNLMDPERLKDFILNIKLAHFFGCRYIVSSVGEAHLKEKVHTGSEKAAENIKQLIPYLEKYNMKLSLETHGVHAGGRQMLDIVTRVDSPLVGIAYDTANVIFYSGLRPEQDISTCIDYVNYIHVKDKAGADKEWNFPAPGKGGINFPAIIKMLDAADNDCPLMVEIEYTENGAGSLAQADQAVRDAAEYLKGLGFTI